MFPVVLLVVLPTLRGAISPSPTVLAGVTLSVSAAAVSVAVVAGGPVASLSRVASALRGSLPI